jgi:hypothetical protein
MRVKVLVAVIFGVLGARAESDVWWPPFEILRGDANNDLKVDLADPLAIQRWLFMAGSPPACLAAADANDDGAVNLSDVVYLNRWLFQSGPPPSAPFPYCGHDPEPSDLPCSNPACVSF